MRAHIDIACHIPEVPYLEIHGIQVHLHLVPHRGDMTDGHPHGEQNSCKQGHGYGKSAHSLSLYGLLSPQHRPLQQPGHRQHRTEDQQISDQGIRLNDDLALAEIRGIVVSITDGPVPQHQADQQHHSMYGFRAYFFYHFRHLLHTLLYNLPIYTEGRLG